MNLEKIIAASAFILISSLPIYELKVNINHDYKSIPVYYGLVTLSSWFGAYKILKDKN